MWFSAGMDDAASARVGRLITWIKAHHKEALDQDGQPSATWLAARTGKKVSYWSDVLRIGTSGKSFGASSARATEDALKMSPLYLEGSGWPFESVDQDRFDKLSERQKGRVEQALSDIIAAIESESGKRLSSGGQ